jgi:TQXA domain-containing protein/LPXTG-motif cell wall-anchored protein
VLAAVVLATAAPASADQVTGTVLDDSTAGLNVNVGAEWLADLPTELLGLRLSDGTTLDVYCVEISTTIDYEQPMVEKDWADHPAADSPFTANQAGINWILHNGFPVVSTDRLATRLAGAGATLTGGLSAEEAIAGTQAAIWHLSDATDLDRENPVPGQAAAGRDVLALYDFLTGPANVGIGAQPAPSLKIEPEVLSGAAGRRLGPFTVRTNGSVEKLTADLPDGVTVVDESGAKLDAAEIEDGTRLFVDVPAGAADGTAEVALTATARVETGRLFVGRDYGAGNVTQSLIVAQAESSQVTATARGTWPGGEPGQTADNAVGGPVDDNAVDDNAVDNAVATEEPAPEPQAKNASDLAETGASLLTPGLVGLALVGLGFVVLLVRRNRRTV